MEYRAAKSAVEQWKQTKGNQANMSPDAIDLVFEMIQLNEEEGS